MYLVFMGESGNTGNSINDPNQPHHIHVGLLVHESQSTSMNGEYNALYRRHFGRPPGEPGSPKGLRPADIYQGMGIFSSWAIPRLLCVKAMSGYLLSVTLMACLKRVILSFQ